MTIVKLFIAAVLSPPSFSEWQSMNCFIDMLVTGVAFLFREVSQFSLFIGAFIALSLIATLVLQEIKSVWVDLHPRN